MTQIKRPSGKKDKEDKKDKEVSSHFDNEWGEGTVSDAEMEMVDRWLKLMDDFATLEPVNLWDIILMLHQDSSELASNLPEPMRRAALRRIGADYAATRDSSMPPEEEEG